MTAAPWDQRPDETPEAFARFLAYRNLGPGRTLPQAQRCHTGGKQGKNWQRACGQWNDESARFDWVSRATAWDVAMLTKHGEALAVSWMAVIVNATRKAAEKLCDPKFTPKSWRDVLSVIDAVGKHLSPEVLGPLLSRTQRTPEPPDSCSLDRFGYKPVNHSQEDAP